MPLYVSVSSSPPSSGDYTAQQQQQQQHLRLYKDECGFTELGEHVSLMFDPVYTIKYLVFRPGSVVKAAFCE